jgi:hypothetical protein
MSPTTTLPQSEELTRLEILRAFKKHFAGKGDHNISPFAEDRVVRYRTDVSALDVPEIHQDVRQAIEANLGAVQRGETSRVVILAGEPGMGKSHLINYFRDPKKADELGYVLVCNSNHWKVDEFHEFLLDAMLDALCRPSPDGPHLLLDVIHEVAFQALGQILQRPGQLRRFTGSRDRGVWRRVWDRLFGSRQARFQLALEKKDSRVFRRLNFDAFSEHVCKRFLQEQGNPFHRYVLRVLLRYVFPEEREIVLHWLRRKPVRSHFLDRLGAHDAIDREFKVIDTIKVLISLLSPEVARGLNPASATNAGKVFFFAFDQIEGRQELFEQEGDWFKFFAQLSELYNTLPNIFILFTMTLGLRDRLYPKMERQFKSRIQRDYKFVLREMTGMEVLAVYRKRVLHWLGEALPDIRPQLDDPRFMYLPFRAEDVAKFCQGKTLRDSLEEMETRFRNEIVQGVTLEDPRFEYLVIRNELKEQEEDGTAFQYTQGHLTNVTALMNQAGGFFAGAYGLAYTGLAGLETEAGLPAMRLEFRHPRYDDQWVRVFLVWLPFQFNRNLPSAVDLLHHLHTEKNFLWLVRPERVDAGWAQAKPEQIFVRKLEASVETSLRAMLRLLDKHERFKADTWPEAEKVLLEEFKLTYLGEMLHHMAEALGTDATMSREPAAAVQPLVEAAEEVVP